MYFALAFAAALLPAPSSFAQSPSRDLAQLRARAPEATILWLETCALEPLLREGFDHPWAQAILGAPLVAADLKRDGVDPVAGAAALEALLGRSPFDLAHALGSGGLALGAMDLTRGDDSPFAMLRGTSEDAMEEAIEELEAVLTGLGLLATPSALERRALGSKVRSSWSFRDGAGYAAWTRDGTLVLAKDHGVLVECCGLSGRSDALRAARGAASSAAQSFAWFDLDGIEAQVGLGDLRKIASQPAPQFLLGPALSYLGRARQIGFELTHSAGAIHLRTLGTGVELGPGAGAFPTSGPGTWDAGPPSSIVAGTLHRDLGFLLQHRTELFPPRAQPELAEGLSGLALLVGGPDALDEVLGALQPTIRIESAAVSFPEDATPDVPLPSLSLLIDVDRQGLNGAG